MKDKVLYLIIGVLCLMLIVPDVDAQVRISFAGPNDPDPMVPVGSFDETVDTAVEICLPCLLAPDNEYKIRFTAWHHEKNGYPELPDTEGPVPGAWRCIAYLEPGQVVIGYGHTGDTYPWHIVHGDTWKGYHPSEFTHMTVFLYYPDYTDDNQVYGWVRQFTVPIVWTSGPVPAEQSTWGGVKGKYGSGE